MQLPRDTADPLPIAPGEWQGPELASSGNVSSAEGALRVAGVQSGCAMRQGGVGAEWGLAAGEQQGV